MSDSDTPNPAGNKKPDHEPAVENRTPRSGEQSQDLNWDPAHDPLHKDEEQAEASEYGLYGYSTEPGQAFYEEAELHQDAEGEEEAAAREEEQTDGVSQGGQEPRSSEHGSGFDQPLNQPQRDASRSTRPKNAE